MNPFVVTKRAKVAPGPQSQAFAVNPAVAAIAKTQAGQSFANATEARIDFDTLVYDPQSTITTGASWAFTAPIDGVYLFQGCVDVAPPGGGWPITTGPQVILYLGAVLKQYMALERAPAAHASRVTMPFTGSIKMLVGESASVRLIQNSGGAATLPITDGMVYVTITRVGGVT